MGAVAVVLAVSVSGCTGTGAGIGAGTASDGLAPVADQTAVPPRGIPLADLVGRWELAEYVTEDGQVTTVEPRSESSEQYAADTILFFADGRMIDSAKCAAFDGDYLADDGILRFDNLNTYPVAACLNLVTSGYLWESGVELSLDGDRLDVTSASTLPADYPDKDAYIRTFVFDHVSADPGEALPRESGIE